MTDNWPYTKILTGYVLGASIIVANAGKLAHIWVIAIEKHLKLRGIAQMIAPYPTWGEVNKAAAAEFSRPLLTSRTTRTLARVISWLPYPHPFHVRLGTLKICLKGRVRCGALRVGCLHITNFTVHHADWCAPCPIFAIVLASPRGLSKSAEVIASENDVKTAAYEIRTKSGECGGLEKNGHRERILGLGSCVAMRRSLHEGPCLLGIRARSQAGGERWTRTDWRRIRTSASRYALDLKSEASNPRVSLSRSVIRQRGYAVRSLRLCRIEFSVHTATGIQSAH